MFRLLLVMLACFYTAQTALAEQKKASRPLPVVGWVEKVKLIPSEMVFNANLLAGASGTVLHAEDITRFKREGVRYARFTLTDRLGNKKTLEREVLRIVKVKRGSGEAEKRVVVLFTICLGGISLEAPVELTDRSDREFRMVMGRDALAGNVVINPGLSYTVEPGCKAAAKGTP